MNKPYDRKLTGNRCQCQGCYEYFNSIYAFDEHRAGNCANDGKNRHCLTIEEMESRGFVKNRLDFWVRRKSDTSALRRMRSSAHTAEPLP
jgi:hypothetical protein